ncbi:MAG: hypothetical protein EBT24_08895 [Betaproteobacteria bacterium]|nr:hypothetical protein [Betaproteobacteria bacterium]NBX96986.1 hypothetical protein [Betaproteobacteria bacterium]
MIKIFIGFVVFAALALFILSRGGDIDMSGEKHGIESHEPAASAPVAASAGSQPASAATPASK